MTDEEKRNIEKKIERNLRWSCYFLIVAVVLTLGRLALYFVAR